MSLSSADTPTLMHFLTPLTFPSQQNLCSGNSSVQSGNLKLKGHAVNAIYSNALNYQKCPKLLNQQGGLVSWCLDLLIGGGSMISSTGATLREAVPPPM